MRGVSADADGPPRCAVASGSWPSSAPRSPRWSPCSVAPASPGRSTARRAPAQPRAGPPRRRRRLDVRRHAAPASCSPPPSAASSSIGGGAAAHGRAGRRAARQHEGRADEGRPDGQLPRRRPPGAGPSGAGRAAGGRSADVAATWPPRSSSASSARPPGELFVEWDPEPIAAASIGQVHRAVAVDPATGEERAVAVKVQYPGVGDAIESDLANTELLGMLLKQGFGGLDPAEMVAEIQRAHHRGARLRPRGRATSSASPTFYRGHPFIHVPGRAAVAVDVAGCSPASSSPGRRGGTSLGVGSARARPRRRGPVPVRVPQPLHDAGVQRRPAPRQLPVPRRRQDHVPRLRAGPLLHASRRWRRSPRWSARPPSSTTRPAFRRIVEDAGLLRRDAPVPTDRGGRVLLAVLRARRRRPGR